MKTILAFAIGFITTLIAIYFFYHLVKDLKKYIPFWKNKWLKEKCRDFCVLCDYRDVCESRLDLEVDWKNGYEQGYDAGLEDCKINLERSELYKEGYKDGEQDAYKKVIDLAKKL